MSKTFFGRPCGRTAHFWVLSRGELWRRHPTSVGLSSLITPEVGQVLAVNIVPWKFLYPKPPSKVPEADGKGVKGSGWDLHLDLALPVCPLLTLRRLKRCFFLFIGTGSGTLESTRSGLRRRNAKNPCFPRFSALLLRCGRFLRFVFVETTSSKVSALTDVPKSRANPELV